MQRSRWTRARLATAAFLCGRGETETSIAHNPMIGSTLISVRDQLRIVGLAARPDSGLEVMVAVPVAHVATFAAVARARGRREHAEDLLAKMVSVLVEEPTMIANVLDDIDDAGFDARLQVELTKLADRQADDAFKIDRSERAVRRREASALAA